MAPLGSSPKRTDTAERQKRAPDMGLGVCELMTMEKLIMETTSTPASLNAKNAKAVVSSIKKFIREKRTSHTDLLTAFAQGMGMKNWESFVASFRDEPEAEDGMLFKKGSKPVRTLRFEDVKESFFLYSLTDYKGFSEYYEISEEGEVINVGHDVSDSAVYDPFAKLEVYKGLSARFGAKSFNTFGIQNLIDLSFACAKSLNPKKAESLLVEMIHGFEIENDSSEKAALRLVWLGEKVNLDPQVTESILKNAKRNPEGKCLGYQLRDKERASWLKLQGFEDLTPFCGDILPEGSMSKENQKNTADQRGDESNLPF